MLSLNPRCGQSQFRRFFTYTPKGLIEELRWLVVIPWVQHGVTVYIDGKAVLSVHNLTRYGAWRMVKRFNRGAESYGKVTADRGH